MRPISKIIKNENPLYIIKMGGWLFYNRYVRRLLPHVECEYNGVIVRADRLFDSTVPWINDAGDKPDYESALVEEIQEYVEKGDVVTIVGGGWRVSTVRATNVTGPDGEVHTYEASVEYVERLKETLDRNDCGENVTVHAKSVATPGELYGDSPTAAPSLHPSSLPKTDVLVLDCEGSEIEILQNLDQTPRTLIVESHGVYGSSTAEVKNSIKKMGYSVDREEIAEKSGERKRFCKEHDIRVITAT